MKILLDECVDWRLLRDLAGFDAKTVAQRGWRETKNGALLALAATEFDVFVTIDTNLALQQNLSALPLSVIVLHGVTTRLRDLRTLLPALRKVLSAIRPGELVHVRGESARENA